MRIAYCTNVRLPSERAHGHQIAKVTKALRDLREDVEIFAPYRENSIRQSFSSYYGLPDSVHLHHLGVIDYIAAWWAPGIIGLHMTTMIFGRILRSILRSRKNDFDLLYTRTPELLPYLQHLGIPIILELHKIPRLGRRKFLKLLRSCKLIVALTSPMRQALIDLGVTGIPVIVEGDGVDLHDYETVPSGAMTRASLGTPEGTPLIVYTGSLQSMGLSKGIEVLIDALDILRKRGLDFRAVIAGGPDNTAERFQETMPEELRKIVNFTGHISHLKIPTLQMAADVLVYPAPASDHPFYQRDTSPLKIYEYMAAGRPIVTADLPPIHDALDETMAIFCPAGNSEAFAEAIRVTLEETDQSEKRAKIARAHSENFTWEKRMQRILAQ